MTPRPCKYIFGPVPSRRLGHSLGVDLVPFKTCTYDCIYCQLGRTTVKTLERKEYVPVEAVLAELESKLAEGVSPDYVTLSGSSEPTLHSRLGELIAGIRRRTRIPLAVLTNGSLLWDPAVRQGLAEADVVIPSLDAGDDPGFRYVNRPHPDLSFDRMVEGLRAFRREFKGQMWLEVLLLGGVTGIQAEVEKIASLAKEIAPDKVQLNTVTRPPAESYALSAPKDLLTRLAFLFDPPAEVVAECQDVALPSHRAVEREDLLALLARRPCTLRDVADSLGLHLTDAAKRLEGLRAQGRVATTFQDGKWFYALVRPVQETLNDPRG